MPELNHTNSEVGDDFVGQDQVEALPIEIVVFDISDLKSLSALRVRDNVLAGTIGVLKTSRTVCNESVDRGPGGSAQDDPADCWQRNRYSYRSREYGSGL